MYNMYTLNKQKEFTMSTKAILIDLMKAISAYQGQGKTSALEAFNCAAKAHLAGQEETARSYAFSAINILNKEAA